MSQQSPHAWSRTVLDRLSVVLAESLNRRTRALFLERKRCFFELDPGATQDVKTAAEPMLPDDEPQPISELLFHELDEAQRRANSAGQDSPISEMLEKFCLFVRKERGPEAEARTRARIAEVVQIPFSKLQQMSPGRGQSEKARVARTRTAGSRKPTTAAAPPPPAPRPTGVLVHHRWADRTAGYIDERIVAASRRGLDSGVWSDLKPDWCLESVEDGPVRARLGEYGVRIEHWERLDKASRETIKAVVRHIRSLERLVADRCYHLDEQRREAADRTLKQVAADLTTKLRPSREELLEAVAPFRSDLGGFLQRIKSESKAARRNRFKDVEWLKTAARRVNEYMTDLVDWDTSREFCKPRHIAELETKPPSRVAAELLAGLASGLSADDIAHGRVRHRRRA